ncbi:MAG TPA: tetratricopeptide repeat protein [Isosphaeraceae bacterium]|nr:tetratricopeptide repeat protein [Isosphaeraceae bacterium]
MKALRVVFRLGLLIGLAIAMEPTPTSAQTTSPNEAQPPAPGLRKLTGEDEQRAKELDEQIDAAVKADRFEEAIARAEELFALRARAQGPKHFETVDAEWRVKTLRRVAPMPKANRVAYESAKTRNHEAETLLAQGKYAQAQPLFEQALEIRRRLLTDDHPQTASSYNNVAVNLMYQGKYAAAQPLYEKALEINRRLLTDDHPNTAISYNSLAANLSAQGKYLAARDRWISAVKSLDAARLTVAFTGLERAGNVHPVRPALAAVLARLSQPVEAWQSLEQDLGRSLLDELTARLDRRLAPGDRARLRELTAEL